MSAYLQQEFDFIKRTIAIIDQYDRLAFQYSVNRKGEVDNEKYEITLLLNCLVGLLILPKERWFEQLPKDIISAKEWGIDGSHIVLIKGKLKGKYVVQAKTVKNVATHLRNSISHLRFIAFANSQNELSKIKFEDFSDRKKTVKTFEATIPIPPFKKFISKFANSMLESMSADR